MTAQVLTIRPLDALARRINEQQAQIEGHAQSLLFYAVTAGSLLIEAKKQCPHGTFKAWVEANTKVKYVTAAEYMRVARVAKAKNLDLQTFDGGVRAFLDQHRDQPHATTKAPTSNLPTFTQDDAEYALKIAARIDSDFEGESAAAKAKLEGFAKSHGMTGEECLEKAKGMCPAEEPLSPFDEGVQKLMEPYVRMTKRDLLERLLRAFATYPGLIKSFQEDIL